MIELDLLTLIQEMRRRHIVFYRHNGMSMYYCEPGSLTAEITSAIRYYQGALADALDAQGGSCYCSVCRLGGRGQS